MCGKQVGESDSIIIMNAAGQTLNLSMYVNNESYLWLTIVCMHEVARTRGGCTDLYVVIHH